MPRTLPGKGFRGRGTPYHSYVGLRCSRLNTEHGPTLRAESSLGVGFLESTTRRLRSHRIPTAWARFGVSLNRVGLLLPYELLCTCLSLGTRRSIPNPTSRPATNGYGSEIDCGPYGLLRKRISCPALFWERTFGAEIHRSTESGPRSVP